MIHTKQVYIAVCELTGIQVDSFELNPSLDQIKSEEDFVILLQKAGWKTVLGKDGMKVVSPEGVKAVSPEVVKAVTK